MDPVDRSRISNKGFAKSLEARTRKFAVNIIRLSGKLPKTPEGKVVRNQVTKSGTSVGANYREANRSRSRAEFKSRIKICESEASETQYLDRIDSRSRLVDLVSG
jgi:four helix bundle protein